VDEPVDVHFGAPEAVRCLLWRERYECVWVGLGHSVYQSASGRSVQEHFDRVVTDHDSFCVLPAIRVIDLHGCSLFHYDP
jgi:hypothetical protein